MELARERRRHGKRNGLSREKDAEGLCRRRPHARTECRRPPHKFPRHGTKGRSKSPGHGDGSETLFRTGRRLERDGMTSEARPSEPIRLSLKEAPAHQRAALYREFVSRSVVRFDVDSWRDVP